MKKRFSTSTLCFTAAVAALAGNLWAQPPIAEVTVDIPNTHEFSVSGMNVFTEEAREFAATKCLLHTELYQKVGHVGLRMEDIKPCAAVIATGKTYKPAQVAGSLKVNAHELHRLRTYTHQEQLRNLNM